MAVLGEIMVPGPSSPPAIPPLLKTHGQERNGTKRYNERAGQGGEHVLQMALAATDIRAAELVALLDFLETVADEGNVGERKGDHQGYLVGQMPG